MYKQTCSSIYTPINPGDSSCVSVCARCKKSHWAPGLQGEGDWLGLGISQIADSAQGEELKNLRYAAPSVKGTTPSVEKKFNKKVEVVADPGAFEGDRARFAEWWIKLQIWVKANWDAFADDFEVATAVLSRLKGPVAGRYAQVRLQECYTAGVWPTWDDLKIEIEKYFKPQAERDWARQQIRSFKQGNMRTDDFVTRFLALSIQGGLGNEHAVELLEPNVNPRIAEQIYLQDTRSDNLALAAEEVRRVELRL
ncbi:hypothetical protein SERLA73DRAFT_154416 [Serpula lacrymans var. lacrymans S7.3]|uniref:Retrotransposon gag domain-containing protein n=1 Tax=Serpula lacrymans var. lacrymans (strain S7.3) TaxID=936435 RepID=F8Q5M8_SERL3|nr:hypothetical protein SERLA73DRAFT_154416 [Serpula lacrymans var. lacrymans S7.3]